MFYIWEIHSKVLKQIENFLILKWKKECIIFKFQIWILNIKLVTQINTFTSFQFLISTVDSSTWILHLILSLFSVFATNWVSINPICYLFFLLHILAKKWISLPITHFAILYKHLNQIHNINIYTHLSNKLIIMTTYFIICLSSICLQNRDEDPRRNSRDFLCDLVAGC